MLSMKLTGENGKKNATLQGHKFSDLPTALENKQTTLEGSRNFSY